MDPADPTDGRVEPELPDLCDVCGAALADGEELYAVVPDSSAVHAADPGLDGRRVLTACTVDHLAELVEEYRRRPFVDEEQWAGKVCRALQQSGGTLTLRALAAVCGLSEEEVERGVDWHNERARRWREEFGDEAGA